MILKRQNKTPKENSVSRMGFSVQLMVHSHVLNKKIILYTFKQANKKDAEFLDGIEHKKWELTY